MLHGFSAEKKRIFVHSYQHLRSGQFLGTSSSTDCLEIKVDKGQALEKTQSWPAIIVRGHDLQSQICFA
jgi:S-adenosylmethionine hydrolase